VDEAERRSGSRLVGVECLGASSIVTKISSNQRLLPPTTFINSQITSFKMAKSGLPAIRACLFDMDGLLIDSEDLYTICTNEVLREYGRPDLPWNIKAQLQGRPGPEVCLRPSLKQTHPYRPDKMNNQLTFVGRKNLQ
jgi:hypothetical protein